MKNTHLQHPEDSILTGDLTVLDWMLCPGNVSVKIDGAPAIVWGKDPATGTFFVGTKAVFNKKKIRIAHSHQEIDLHYEGEVNEILHACFDYLPRTDFIIQGDFIGFGGAHLYKPNAITYVFPSVISQNIVIAPHTYYLASKDLRDAEAYQLNFKLVDNSFCKFIIPKASMQEGDFSEVVAFVRQMSTMVQFIEKKQRVKVEKVINTFIKTGAVLDEEAMSYAAQCDVNLIRLWKLVKQIKEDMLLLCANDGPKAILSGKDVGAEGYVMANPHGMYKLVQREVFSQYNFNHGRFQRKTSC